MGLQMSRVSSSANRAKVVVSTADQIAEWLKSSDGRRTVQESITRSAEAVKQLNEARSIDPKLLQEPITL